MMSDSVWEDRDIRFDVSSQQMKLRCGEVQIDVFTPVEDTKGNSGDRGKLILTNLRLIWHSLPHPRVNLSIGLDTIVHVGTRTINSVLGGVSRALYILTKVPGGTRFEFIFTALGDCGERMFSAVMGVHKAYNSSRVYRELKLRTALFENKRLKLLPAERVCSSTPGVWNLSSDQGNLGTLVLTNIRLVWHSDLNELFNLSLPYLRLSSVRVRDSKFGKALVVETTSSSGGYVLGFRIDAPNGGNSQELLDSKVKEIRALKEVHGKCPDFGVHYTVVNGVKQKIENCDEAGLGRRDVEDCEEEIIQRCEESDSFAAYFADLGGKQCDRDPVYDPDLGLAVERVKDGFTLESLWHVSPPTTSSASE